jgi:hypothetical protein
MKKRWNVALSARPHLGGMIVTGAAGPVRVSIHPRLLWHGYRPNVPQPFYNLIRDAGHRCLNGGANYQQQSKAPEVPEQ